MLFELPDFGGEARESSLRGGRMRKRCVSNGFGGKNAFAKYEDNNHTTHSSIDGIGVSEVHGGSRVKERPVFGW